MKFKISEKLYTDSDSDKLFRKNLVKIKLKRPVNGLYVVTLPLYEAGIMEIYDYNELLQPYYRKLKRTIEVLGVSRTREGAKQLTCDILEDVFSEYGNPNMSTNINTNIKEYFKF